jgi:hypothetical protein
MHDQFSSTDAKSDMGRENRRLMAMGMLSAPCSPNQAAYGRTPILIWS